MAMAEPNPRGGKSSCGKNPFVFVVGCPRSGTTLLQRMLDNHPLLAVANDTHFIPKAVSDLTPGTDPVLTTDLIDGAVNYRRFYRLGLSPQQIGIASEKGGRYSDFVSQLYGQYAEQHGKQLAGEKTPDYVKRMPFLHGLFPAAKFVHIIRDGRDVALSVRQWANKNKGPGRLALWQTEPIGVSALWWAGFVAAGRRDGVVLGPNTYLDVKYEDLVSRPDLVLTRIASFLDLPFSDQMLRFHEGRERNRPSLSAKGAWRPATAGLRDWRAQMSARDLGLFEALSGDLLEELGYEKGVDTAPPDIAKAASICVERWRDRSRTHAIAR